jgi:hypothetical protein
MVILERSHVANRNVWLGVGLNDGQSVRRVCREAASFVRFIRQHRGLPEECGTDKPETAWIWTVLELAAAGVPGSLLKLEEGGVFRFAGCDVWATEDELARAGSIPPTANDLYAQIMRRDFDLTRYWQLEDLVEASIQVMDVVEVAITSGASAPAGSDGSNTVSSTAPPPAKAGKRPRRPRGEPAAELLRKLWSTPEGKQQILTAGSAEKVALMIGKSKTAVVEAGPIWDDKIAPQLKAQRDLVRYHRSEEKLGG